MRSNKSLDTDTQRHCAAGRAGERTSRGAMPLRAGQLGRYAANADHRGLGVVAAFHPLRGSSR